LSGRCRLRKTAAGWETAMQTPGEEHGLADSRVMVRQTSNVKSPHQHRVSTLDNFLRPIDNRPQVNNLPYSGKGI
jgi:hypothetical protein